MALSLAGAPAPAQGQSAPAPQADTESRGPVTGLPIPRYVSLKSSGGRARRGPAMSHRVDWVFTRRDMPLRVVAEFENWRRVEDADGQGGWMHYTLLSGVRTVLVTGDMVPMRSQPRNASSEIALLEMGVIARIMTCEPQWCRLQVDGQRGWVERRALWGVEPEEFLD